MVKLMKTDFISSSPFLRFAFVSDNKSMVNTTYKPK